MGEGTLKSLQSRRTPYGPGFYISQRDESRRSAAVIVPIVMGLTAPRSVLDVGCGVGTWLSEFAERGAEVQGVDGEHVAASMTQIDPEKILRRDLSRPLALGRRFDLVVSLEVAEHIPAVAAAAFVRSLIQHGDTVLFSAAVPHQGGTGHVNEQWPSYWVSKFERHGYQVLDLIRPSIWHDSRVSFWYRQNVMLFASSESAARLVEATRGWQRMPVLDIVHPELLEHPSPTIASAVVYAARRQAWRARNEISRLLQPRR
jgi:SAM-dependent methyltransferase